MNSNAHLTFKSKYKGVDFMKQKLFNVAEIMTYSGLPIMVIFGMVYGMLPAGIAMALIAGAGTVSIIGVIIAQVIIIPMASRDIEGID